MPLRLASVGPQQVVPALRLVVRPDARAQAEFRVVSEPDRLACVPRPEEQGDRPEQAKADIFPAYDDDGGLLLVLTPR